MFKLLLWELFYSPHAQPEEEELNCKRNKTRPRGASEV